MNLNGTYYSCLTACFVFLQFLYSIEQPIGTKKIICWRCCNLCVWADWLNMVNRDSEHQKVCWWPNESSCWWCGGDLAAQIYKVRLLMWLSVGCTCTYAPCISLVLCLSYAEKVIKMPFQKIKYRVFKKMSDLNLEPLIWIYLTMGTINYINCESLSLNWLL